MDKIKSRTTFYLVQEAEKNKIAVFFLMLLDLNVCQMHKSL